MGDMADEMRAKTEKESSGSKLLLFSRVFGDPLFSFEPTLKCSLRTFLSPSTSPTINNYQWTRLLPQHRDQNAASFSLIS